MMATSSRTSTRASRKRKRERESLGVDDTDLQCPACSKLFVDAYSTLCGHSFCYSCISNVLTKSASSTCPVCKTTLPAQSDSTHPILPNFTLNNLVSKYKKKKKKTAFEVAVEAVSSSNENDLPRLFDVIQDMLKNKEEKDARMKAYILNEFISECKKRKEEQLLNVKRQLEVMTKDLEEINSQDQSVQKNITEDSGEAARRKLRIHSNLDELLDAYLALRMPVLDAAAGIEPKDPTQLVPFAGYSEVLDTFTKFSALQELSSSLHYEGVVSSIGFDRDWETFAVAGLAKKIQLYNFAYLLPNAESQYHYPICEMTCPGKISSVVFNPYHKNKLASSDYEGYVCIWDANTGTQKTLHHEHNSRIWNVAFNSADPTVYISGSDDCTVRVWHATQSHSIFTISTKASVCSVQFHPVEKNYFAFGSADHSIYLYDLRNPHKELKEVKGHAKTVSYVKYLSEKELLSASVDGELRQWTLDTGQTTKIFKGHTNRKRFVGLSSTTDYIACGSEDNSLFIYYKKISSPMLTYKFPVSDDVTKEEYVSAVCWKKDSNMVVAANSSGVIQVLELQ